MKDFDERLFFEHDLATPFSNLLGAHYLLEGELRDASPSVQESLAILGKNIRSLERMLYWYWRIRDLDGKEKTAWNAASLAPELKERLADPALPVEEPEWIGNASDVVLDLPRDAVRSALLGAALSLANASGQSVSWSLSADAGRLTATYRLVGNEDLLDAGRLLQKTYWSGRDAAGSPDADAGLAYLGRLAGRSGGAVEISWQEGRWRVEAVIQGSPGGKDSPCR
ncbi:MAG: hypothetical protein P8Z49_00250 [Acidobacteriota bacterium]|jgi:hypothetical protein